jgi:predicted TPR repeat methyltransferase
MIKSLDLKEKFNSLLGVYEKKIFEFRDFIKDTRYKLKNLIQTNFNLGIYHFKKNHITDAYFRFKMVLYFDPNNAMAHYYLANCLVIKNKNAKAIEVLNKAMINGCFCSESKYLLATLDATYPKPEDIPEVIVENYFDHLANERASELLPNQATEFLDEYLKNKAYEHANILDLGCGSGNMGLYFKKKYENAHLFGIDISAAMLDLARQKTFNQKPIYDVLSKDNMHNFLLSNHNKYGLIMAFDSLNYDKKMHTVLQEAKSLLNLGGEIIFTVEKSTHTEVALNKRMNNFCFPKDYIEHLSCVLELTLLEIKEYKVNDEKTNWFVVLKSAAIN